MTRWETLGFIAVASALACGCTVEIGDTDFNHNEYLDGFGPCDDDASCAVGSHCVFDVGTCGSVAGRCVSGEAVDHPCSTQTAPVCGCDGQSYENECAALQSGAAVEHDGACAVTTPEQPPEQTPPQQTPPDDTCGGTSCSGNDFCAFEEGSCGSDPSNGSCMDPLAVCTSTTTPVCGCDGITYSGRCDAQHAGVSVFASGEC